MGRDGARKEGGVNGASLAALRTPRLLSPPLPLPSPLLAFHVKQTARSPSDTR